MAFLSVDKIKIAGLSAAVPKNKISNRDYNWISTEEREKLIGITGIEERRFAEDGVTSSDLCFEAAEKLLETLRWKREEISLLIFVSQMRDFVVPCTSAILQDRLELSKNCLTMDIPYGCTGYLYGLSTAGSLMKNSNIEKALLLIGDVPTPYASYKDRSSFPLFGDAGTATALEKSNSENPFHFSLQTDGSGFEAIMIPDGGARNPTTAESLLPKEFSPEMIRNSCEINIDGSKIFEFALNEVDLNFQNHLAFRGFEKEDFDYFVFHQANKILNETLRKTMELKAEKVPYSLKLFGNTVTSSIPLTMVTELRDQLISEKMNLAIIGFGVGLSWGSAFIHTENLVCPPLIEI